MLLPYPVSFFSEILATQVQILLFLNLSFQSFGMSVSCSLLWYPAESLWTLSLFLFFFFPFPVIPLHVSQFKLTGWRSLFTFAIWLQGIPLKDALRSSFPHFIVCLIFFLLLMTFAAVSILYWWPKSWIHVNWSFFGFMSSKCCHLIYSVPVCMMLPKRSYKTYWAHI